MMSAMNVSSTKSVEPQPLSKKFEKETFKFFEWARSEGYTVNNVVDDENVEWSTSIVPSFVEPARNKLDAFLKNVMSNYFIRDKSGASIEDNKVLVKMFRQASKNSVKDEAKVPLVESHNVKEVITIAARVETNTLNSNTKEEVEKVGPSESEESMEKKSVRTKVIKEVVIDDKIDTSAHIEIDTLKYKTNKLVNAFGVLEEGEWKFRIGRNEYSIYNKADEWYLGGKKVVKVDKKRLCTFIDKANKDCKDQKDLESLGEKDLIKETEDLNKETQDRSDDQDDTKSELDLEDIIVASDDDDDNFV
jgi:hypothetical protein